LNPVLDALRKIPGFVSVQQDDFDSSGINVVITLEDDVDSRHGTLSGNKSLRFCRALGKQPIRRAKNAINKAVKGAGRGFNFLDWPKMTYASNGSVYGKRLRSADGYDGNTIKIEVFA
jgi:hypothetical protein